ncbi:MAG: hypothetical protein C0601_04705 [Candidatus Muiribacterium halophilum]|uniref:4Fe-4S ferredoxin-type domain-containing protein n=1 Tax=Muiribacterium halophilum TaxID=2053465 RepID=A0A2N5ZI51_MUIH1|nr:MAG: hypothetical protein C0601_04705 [Candidatus Muirbacterium halophilum]
MDCHLWFKKNVRFINFIFIIIFFSLFVFSEETNPQGIYQKENDYILKSKEICPQIIGYIGHIDLDIEFSKDLFVRDIKITGHKETPAYIKYITDKKSFLDRFIGKDLIEIADDVDAITGATYSSKAIKDEVIYCGNYLSAYLKDEELKKNSFNKELILFLIFVVGLNLIYIKFRKKKDLFIAICIFNIFAIFYYFGLQLSISNTISVLLSFFENHILTTFFILIIFVFITGRYYCSHICPFGIFSEFLGSIGLKKKVPLFFNRVLKIFGVIYFLVLIISYFKSMFGLTSDAEVLNYFFRFDTEDKFFILGCILLFFSLFINRFFCRYICPTGILLSIVRIISPMKIKASDICVSCKRCKDVCPTDAIYLDSKDKIRIDQLNCIDCARCVKKCNLQK